MASIRLYDDHGDERASLGFTTKKKPALFFKDRDGENTAVYGPIQAGMQVVPEFWFLEEKTFA